MKLTIILTVYNKEPYLRRSLDSLLSQDGVSIEDYEILVVNDGSTDDSSSIIRDYESKYSHIKVLTQNNMGLSMARNNGIDSSNSEYIWFVDADDVYSNNSVKLILDAIEHKPDIIPIIGNNSSNPNELYNVIDINLKTGKDIIIENRFDHCGVLYIYRRNFLIENNLRFFPGIYHEDAEFTPRMLYFAKKVTIIPEILYTICGDPNSITHVPRAKRAFDYITVATRLYDFVSEKDDVNDDIVKVFATRIAMDINNAFNIIIQNSKEEQNNFNSFFYKNRQLIKLLSSASNIKYRLEAMLFRLFPMRYVFIYRMMKLLG